MLHSLPARLGPGFGNAPRVGVHSNGARAEPPRGRDHDPPVTATQVVEHIVRAQLRQAEHALDDLRRGGNKGRQIRPCTAAQPDAVFPEQASQPQPGIQRREWRRQTRELPVFLGLRGGQPNSVPEALPPAAVHPRAEQKAPRRTELTAK